MSGLAFLLFAMQAIAVPPPLNPVPPPLNEPRAARDTLGFDDPPTELIDFLGRRWRCADPTPDRAERERLHCAALPNEERSWRTRFAGDAAAMRWLDQAPRAFRMEMRFRTTFDGPTPARTRNVAQSGVDERGRPYRLTIDTQADRGRTTRITVAYHGWAERSFTLRNQAFPLIDLQSLAVGIYTLPFRPSFQVQLRYGYARGYCGETMQDDRPLVRISFERARVRGTDTRRTNCTYNYETITDAAAPR
jgi:hypothetical protein